MTHGSPFLPPFHRHHIFLHAEPLIKEIVGLTLFTGPEYTRMDFFKVVRWLPHILKDTDVKKKLKRKHKTYAKNVNRSVVKTNETGNFFDIFLKIMKLTSYCLSAYRSVRDLGWFEYLPAFWEKLSVAIKFIILIYSNFF